MRTMRFRLSMISVLFAALPVILAASPPALLNYQGVLRDASDKPLTGTFDMVFRLYSAPTGGDEILVDSHTTATGTAVTVTGGLFNVRLGEGTVTDGTGPGTYSWLAPVFRDYSEVYLSVQVGSEVLSPRTRIVAAAYALNATHLEGKDSEFFIDTSSTSQTKSGDLAVDGDMTVGSRIRILGGEPSSGRVLTSDSGGLASWQNPVPGPQGPPGPEGPEGPEGPQGPSGVTGRPVHSVTEWTPGEALDINYESNSSVAIGADGLPLVAISPAHHSNFRIMHCLDAACTSGVTTSHAALAGRSSLAIGSNGLGVITLSSARVRTFACQDADCSSVALIDDQSGSDGSLAIGTDGFPLIAFADGPALRVRHCANAGCSTGTTTPFDTATGTKARTSIAIGGDGLGVIAYIDDDANALRVAHCSNAACTAATITTIETTADVSGNLDQGTSIAIRWTGEPIIAFYESTNHYLRVAACTTATCSSATKTNLDTTGSVGTDPAITIGTDGFPFIAYRDHTNADMKTVRCRDALCTSTVTPRTFDSSFDVGLGSSVTIGTDGFPLFVYWRLTENKVNLVHCSNESCLPYVRWH